MRIQLVKKLLLPLAGLISLAGVIWYLPAPQSLLTAEPWQIIALFGPLTLLIFGLLQLFLRSKLIVILLTVDLILGLALYLTAYLSWWSGAGLILATLFIYKIWPRPDKNQLPTKTLKLSRLEKQH